MNAAFYLLIVAVVDHLLAFSAFMGGDSWYYQAYCSIFILLVAILVRINR